MLEYNQEILEYMCACVCVFIGTCKHMFLCKPEVSFSGLSLRAVHLAVFGDGVYQCVLELTGQTLFLAREPQKSSVSSFLSAWLFTWVLAMELGSAP